MIVVADASPLNYLVQLGLAEATLRALYETVLIPDAVRAELLDGATPNTRSKVTSQLIELHP